MRFLTPSHQKQDCDLEYLILFATPPHNLLLKHSLQIPDDPRQLPLRHKYHVSLRHDSKVLKRALRVRRALVLLLDIPETRPSLSFALYDFVFGVEVEDFLARLAHFACLLALLSGARFEVVELGRDLGVCFREDDEVCEFIRFILRRMSAGGEGWLRGRTREGGGEADVFDSPGDLFKQHFVHWRHNLGRHVDQPLR